jgi:hypothetical protein
MHFKAPDKQQLLSVVAISAIALLTALPLTGSAAETPAKAPAAKEAPAQGEPADAVPEPPPIPERVKSGETLEPEVTIIQREEERVEQYSINGQIYAIKVTPQKGAPYYLVDVDGDGKLESRRNDLDADILVPSWVIFQWK